MTGNAQSSAATYRKRHEAEAIEACVRFANEAWQKGAKAWPAFHNAAQSGRRSRVYLKN